MPVFTFEKISPPPMRGVPDPAPAVEKPRGIIVQFLDRFVEMRIKRTVDADQAGQPPQKSAK
jgi:hypothetical protein